jgi:opacity protein-like surface antigen
MIQKITALKLSLLSLFFSAVSFAQDLDLNQMLGDEPEKKSAAKKYIQGTFYSTRLINGQSIENLDAGILDFRIAHRFGKISDGLYDLFGLDNASMRMGLDYGVTDRLMVGLGRSTFQKQVDGFIKYKILSQTEDDKLMPVSLSIMSSLMIQTLKWENPNRKNDFSARMYYAHQAILARKFSEQFSLQLMPTMVHYNLVSDADQSNDLFSMGFGGKYKIMKKVSVNAEYYYQLPGTQFAQTKNAFSLGFDIETGGHVFQLHVTNARGMTERTFIHETDGGWDKGDLLFGFNISRVFALKKK